MITQKEVEEILHNHYKKIGKKGGDALKEKYGKSHFKMLSNKMLEARWGKGRKAKEETQ